MRRHAWHKHRGRDRWRWERRHRAHRVRVQALLQLSQPQREQGVVGTATRQFLVHRHRLRCEALRHQEFPHRLGHKRGIVRFGQHVGKAPFSGVRLGIVGGGRVVNKERRGHCVALVVNRRRRLAKRGVCVVDDRVALRRRREPRKLVLDQLCRHGRSGKDPRRLPIIDLVDRRRDGRSRCLGLTLNNSHAFHRLGFRLEIVLGLQLGCAAQLRFDVARDGDGGRQRFRLLERRVHVVHERVLVERGRRVWVTELNSEGRDGVGCYRRYKRRRHAARGCHTPNQRRRVGPFRRDQPLLKRDIVDRRIGEAKRIITSRFDRVKIEEIMLADHGGGGRRNECRLVGRRLHLGLPQPGIDLVEVDRAQCRIRGRDSAQSDRRQGKGRRERRWCRRLGHDRYDVHGCGKRRQLGGDVIISRVRFKDALVPTARAGAVPFPLGDVAQVAEGLQIFRIEGKRLLEHGTRLGQIARFVQCLAKHNIPAHVLWLLRQELPTEANGLREISCFPQLVRQRGEVATRVFLKLFPELVDPGSSAHPLSALRVMFPGPMRGARSVRVTGPTQQLISGNRSGKTFVMKWCIVPACLAIRDSPRLACRSLRHTPLPWRYVCLFCLSSFSAPRSLAPCCNRCGAPRNTSGSC